MKSVKTCVIRFFFCVNFLSHSADPAPLLDFGASASAAQPGADVWGDFTSAGSK